MKIPDVFHLTSEFNLRYHKKRSPFNFSGFTMHEAHCCWTNTGCKSGTLRERLQFSLSIFTFGLTFVEVSAWKVHLSWDTSSAKPALSPVHFPLFPVHPFNIYSHSSSRLWGLPINPYLCIEVTNYTLSLMTPVLNAKLEDKFQRIQNERERGRETLTNTKPLFCH